ncbi:MAG: hypothetical protein ACREVK_02025 [Gammaproteobacteria bacterium]
MQKIRIRDQKIIDVQSNLDLVNLLQTLLKTFEFNERFPGKLLKAASINRSPLACLCSNKVRN